MVVSPSGYKILVLTSIYPADDVPKEWTPIVHYFTREWIKNDNDVRVVNYVSQFPNIAYRIAHLFKDKISSKVGFVIGGKPLSKREYKLDDVNVFRVEAVYSPKANKEAEDECNKPFFGHDLHLLRP